MIVFKTIWNYDGYIYIYYLRMTAIFFLILTILNLFWLYVYNYVDNDENSPLTPIQRITILSMFGSKTKTLIIYAITIVNSIAGNIFIFRFMNLFKGIEFQASHEDYGDYDVSKTTVMIHDIPSNLPIIECNTLISHIFKSRFGRELEEVHTVGKYDKRKLDNYYSKRNFLEDQIEIFNERKMRSNTFDERIVVYNKDWLTTLVRWMLWWSWCWRNSYGSKRVNMLDYYLEKIKYYDQQILKLKGKGISSNQGISFVTFSSDEWVYETLSDFDLIKDISKNSEASKLMKIDNWYITHAPPPSDIIWENLSNLTRLKRKALRLFYLLMMFTFSSTLIFILAFLDKLSPIMHVVYHQEGKYFYLVMILQYITPTLLLLFNSIVVPLLVNKFVDKSLYIRKSHKERANLTFNYLFLILNSIFIPIGWFSLIYSYELMPTGCFFLRYLTQILFTYCIAHIFGIPMYIEKYFISSEGNDKNFSSSTARVYDIGMLTEAEQTPIHDSNKAHKDVRSNKWYFEIGYQQSFSIAIFSVTFVFAWIIPLIVPVGCLFFFLKYYIDKYNMVYGYRIEYEADAYIRKVVWTFAILSITFYQMGMGFVFIITGDDDMIILAFLLFLFSILSVYYFTSTEAWKGKITKHTKQYKEDTDEYEDKTDSNGSLSKSIDLKLNKKKSSSNFGSTYRPEKFNVEGMTPPSASPFIAPVYTVFDAVQSPLFLVSPVNFEESRSLE